MTAMGPRHPATVSVNVSAAPLVSLDFTSRAPVLLVGSDQLMDVIGDFADQQGVSLPVSYVSFLSTDTTVATVTPAGRLTAIGSGSCVLLISSHGLQAATVVNVTTEDDFDQSDDTGLDVYPGAVSLASSGGTRQIDVTLDGTDVSRAGQGTLYFVSNPSVIQVGAGGLITGLAPGTSDVTVISFGQEQVISVLVAAPLRGPSTLSVAGGVVEGPDGSLVAVPPGDLSGPTTVNITPLAASDLPMPVPTDLGYGAAFRLDLGDDPLDVPVQLRIPMPAGTMPGTQVIFYEATSLPDATGADQPVWLEVEDGVVGTDGFARTTSPPEPGINNSGTFFVGNSNSGVSIVNGQIYLTVPTGDYVGTLYAMADVDAVRVGATIGTDGSMTMSLPVGLVPLQILEIRPTLLPKLTIFNVSVNPGVTNAFTTTIDNLADANTDPATQILIDSVSLQFEADPRFPDVVLPQVVILGSQFTYDNPEADAAHKLGSQLSNLIVNFIMPSADGPITEKGTILEDLSSPAELHVVVPQAVTLGLAEIQVIRPWFKPTLNSHGVVVSYAHHERIGRDGPEARLHLCLRPADRIGTTGRDQHLNQRPGRPHPAPRRVPGPTLRGRHPG